jgi:hypothetical protein
MEDYLDSNTANAILSCWDIDFDTTLTRTRLSCDEVMRGNMSRGIATTEFEVPRRIHVMRIGRQYNFVFSRRELTEKLAGSLRHSGYYVTIDQARPFILRITVPRTPENTWSTAGPTNDAEQVGTLGGEIMRMAAVKYVSATRDKPKVSQSTRKRTAKRVTFASPPKTPYSNAESDRTIFATANAENICRNVDGPNI